MKRKILALTLSVAVIAASVYASWAYFIAEDRGTGTITAGNIKIQLNEMMLAEGSEELVPYENVTEVIPGAEISKIVTVKNTGNNAAYVRIKVANAIKDENAEEPNEELTALLATYVSYNLNTTNWTYMNDGYYYYNTALGRGEETAPLFTTVKLSETMPNEFQNTSIEIDITAFATQTANNGTSVFDAVGWPN